MGLLELRRLYPSIIEHQKVEEASLRLLESTLEPRFIAPRPRRPRALRYAQKNIFSILFLALYRSLGIGEERRLFYGLVNHAVRGIVTATDNLLDDEYKEMLPLRFPAGATRFKSVMHILLFDRFLYAATDRAGREGVIDPAGRDKLLQRIFDALVPIGEEEATEEGGVCEILSPGEILCAVHCHKGGDLLRLAFVAPRAIEEDKSAPLDLVDRGIFRIGLSLQVIDDLTDCYDDLRDRRHNYLVSVIRHEGTEPERERLARLLSGADSDRTPVEQAFPSSVALVMQRAIGEALAGFEMLHRAGFWLTQSTAFDLIRLLFRIRGVGTLLTLLPKNGPFTLTLESSVP